MQYYNQSFIKENEVWVTIPENREVPFLGKGPFLEPIRISKDNFTILKKMGYNIIPLTNMELIRKPLARYFENVPVLVNNKIQEEDIYKIEHEKEIETVIEVPVVEEVIEIPIVEECHLVEPDVVEEKEDFITKDDINNMTKAQLKEVLDAIGVAYKYKDTLDDLRKLALDNIDFE